MLLQRLQTILNAGTRVAGSLTPGHLKVMSLLAINGTWETPRRALFSGRALAAVEKLPAIYWTLEWDNFTHPTPLGNRKFFNLVFSFGGGAAFRRKCEKETDGCHKAEKRGSRGRPSFAFGPNRTLSKERLGHVVLSAHWDSKNFTQFDFLGACDSAIPLVYLLESMRTMSVLSDTVAVLNALKCTAGLDDASRCDCIQQLLSPTYLAALRYYYAGDEETSACLNGKYRDGKSSRKGPIHNSFFQLLRRVEHIPATTVIFFDGEEAFVKWEGNDNTYGSSHLAKAWKKMRINATTSASHGGTALAASRFDTIDLFVLYDLMGTAGSQFHNFFPDQSGIAFAKLAHLEHMHRRRAAELWKLHEEIDELRRNSGISENEIPNSTHVDEFCVQRLPRLWCVHGPPHDMFTLYGVPKLYGSTHTSSEIAKLWLPPVDNSAPGGRGITNSRRNGAAKNLNVFFPSWEALARGAVLEAGGGVMDDHIHWLETQRVLHLIPAPFPTSWHTAQDDGSEIDGGTVVDLFRILCEFTLHLGEGWMETVS
uniref:Uncharacterized protein TCIL3000_7_5610 n=1 Tax=Trypanosoma congolense (strain IL3000) TaxID=1068625 RepID=G0UQT6_TRYCI|nr:unnamed protein product [Trypanosoma congolense IL3000]